LGAILVLLPALLATTKIITLWDLLGVKLGDDPAQTIPLFAGLRPSQARIVVLMGELRHFQPGEAIVRRGERGDEMYVIIEGTTEVLAGDGSGRQRINQLRRGDAFGLSEHCSPRRYSRRAGAGCPSRTPRSGRRSLPRPPWRPSRAPAAVPARSRGCAASGVPSASAARSAAI